MGIWLSWENICVNPWPKTRTKSPPWVNHNPARRHSHRARSAWDATKFTNQRTPSVYPPGKMGNGVPPSDSKKTNQLEKYFFWANQVPS